MDGSADDLLSYSAAQLKTWLTTISSPGCRHISVHWSRPTPLKKKTNVSEPDLSFNCAPKHDIVEGNIEKRNTLTLFGVGGFWLRIFVLVFQI